MALEILLAWHVLTLAVLVYLHTQGQPLRREAKPSAPVAQPAPEESLGLAPPALAVQPASEGSPGPALAWVAGGREGALSYTADVRGCQARLRRNAGWAPSMWLLVHGVQVWHLRGETTIQAQVVAEAILQREPLCLYVVATPVPGVQ